MYGYICEKCQAHLDPGEHCRCEEEREQKRLQQEQQMANMIVLDKGSNQFVINMPKLLQVISQELRKIEKEEENV